MSKIIITISITNLCNYRCCYCFSRNTIELAQQNTFIDINLVISFLLSLLQKNKYLQLIIIGGEPTLHSQLQLLCIFCKHHNIELVICSNGSKNISYYHDLYKIYNNIHYIFSWHSLSNDKNNNYFITKMVLLSKLIPIHSYEILVSAESFNFDISLYTYKTLLQHINNIQCEYNLLTSTDLCKVVYTQQQKALIASLNQKYDFKCYKYCNNTKHNLIINDIIINNDFNYNNWICDAGKTYIYIGVDGFIYRCYGYFLQNISIGHISSIDITSIFNNISQSCIISKCGLDLTYTNKYLNNDISN